MFSLVGEELRQCKQRHAKDYLGSIDGCTMEELLLACENIQILTHDGYFNQCDSGDGITTRSISSQYFYESIRHSAGQ